LPASTPLKRGETGTYAHATVGGETVRAFLPAALPPKPGLQLEGSLQQSLEAAVLALGRLDGVSTLLPDKSLFLYSYVRKEAVLSSQIEGTQSSLSDLLLFELDELPGVIAGAGDAQHPGGRSAARLDHDERLFDVAHRGTRRLARPATQRRVERRRELRRLPGREPLDVQAAGWNARAPAEIAGVGEEMQHDRHRCGR